MTNPSDLVRDELPGDPVPATWATATAASTAWRTISPVATSVTSLPRRTQVARSIWNGHSSSVYTSSTGLRPTRM